MRAAAAILFLVACASELGGVVLVVREARSLRRVLAGWDEGSNPLRFGHKPEVQVTLMGDVVRAVLNARLRVTVAVTLLVVGIIAGTIGNFLTL